MTAVAWISRMFHTVRYLRPSQIIHRIRLRFLRRLMGAFPNVSSLRLAKAYSEVPGWPSNFEPIDAAIAPGCPSMEKNSDLVFSFLNETRWLTSRADWSQADASQLWRYHLHYFEWAWPYLTEDPDSARGVFGELWRSWSASQKLGRGDAWSPYVASLRAWVFCGVFDALVKDQDIEDDFLDELRLHVGYVNAMMELDVAGNHLIKNLKALIGLGCFFQDEVLLERSLQLLSEQLGIQILKDGGHYERSPSYHCQVLSDLIDIARLLERRDSTAADFLTVPIRSMREWLAAILMPDGDVPLFNDGTLIGCERLTALGVSPLFDAPSLTVLEESGYFVARSGVFHLVGDIGLPCPDDLPAHAHADCLSFELAVNGKRAVVDTGTSTYQPGQRRDYERSTSAHNTVEVDGENQTEIWGTFRAARRARPIKISSRTQDDDVVIQAGHDGYQRLPGSPTHLRTWTLTPDELRVDDQVVGGGRHRVVRHVHLAPDLKTEVVDGSMSTALVDISWNEDHVVAIATATEETVANEFGQERISAWLRIENDSTLPIEMTTRIRISDRAKEGGARH